MARPEPGTIFTELAVDAPGHGGMWACRPTPNAAGGMRCTQRANGRAMRAPTANGTIGPRRESEPGSGRPYRPPLREAVRWFRKSISHSRGNGNFFSRNGKNGLDRRCGLWYNGFTCEKGLIFFALFLPGQFNLSPRLRQGGKIKEVPNMRVKITLRCSECKQRNYNTMKNKKNDPDRLEMKKYCRFCKKHTVHNETK